MTKIDWRTESIPSGPRKLQHLVSGQTRYYDSEESAMRQWAKSARNRFQTSPEHAEASVKIEVREKESGKFYLFGRVHPACFHWSRALELEGVEYEQAPQGLNWRVIPPRTNEELLRMPKSNLGRYWP